MAESKESYMIRASSIPELLHSLNFSLARIADRLDALEGHRDRPVFYSNPKFEAGTAYRQVKTNADKIVEFHTPTSAPTSIDATGSDTVDITYLNNLLKEIYTILTGAAITEGYTSTGADAEAPEDYDVTFGGAPVEFDGEDTTW